MTLQMPWTLIIIIHHLSIIHLTTLETNIICGKTLEGKILVNELPV